MGKYLKEFELTSQYEEYINSTMALLPNVSLINEINWVHYNPKVPNYLKFTAEEDNSTISLNGISSPDIKYSLNGGEWTQWDYSAINLNTGDTVRMKGDNVNGFNTEDDYSIFEMTGKIGASGNIMSLLYDDDFEGKLTIPCEYCYSGMFKGCTSLTTAPELPATTLANYCYSGMFYDCTSLTTAPELPATTLADYCYSYMFRGCTSLTTAPELPATILAESCYIIMFEGCTSLTSAPELPATILAEGCYSNMFGGCTSLVKAPELPATTLTKLCYAAMFYECTSLVKAPEILPATTLAENCYLNMFLKCTSLTTAPELPATILAESCYSNMFYRCYKINYIKMLATDISADYCMSDWVSGVASTGTFIKHPDMTELPTGTSGIPSGWTVQDAA